MSDNSNKHVMHIIESLEFGGAEKVVVHLANMASQKYKVSVCLTKREGELSKQLNKNISIYFLNTGEGNSLALPRKLRALLIRENVDLLHSHDWGVYLESAFAVRNLNKTQLVHTIHGQYTDYPSDWISKLKINVRHFLERRAAKNTYKFIPVSDSIKNYIIEDIGISETKLHRIHNGIEGMVRLNFKPDEKKLNDANNSLKLITIGRTAKIKNYPLLLNALAMAVKQNKYIYLQLVGDGPELESLKLLARQLGVEENIQFLGFRTDVSALLQLNDVFVLSSDYEGISIAVLEAMSLSMSVIATSVGGVPETIIDEHTGYLVEQGNVADYTNAILRMASSKSMRTSLGKNARKLFEEKFHESVVIDQYIEIYEQAMSCC